MTRMNILGTVAAVLLLTLSGCQSPRPVPTKPGNPLIPTAAETGAPRLKALMRPLALVVPPAKTNTYWLVWETDGINNGRYKVVYKDALQQPWKTYGTIQT